MFIGGISLRLFETTWSNLSALLDIVGMPPVIKPSKSTEDIPAMFVSGVGGAGSAQNLTFFGIGLPYWGPQLPWYTKRSGWASLWGSPVITGDRFGWGYAKGGGPAYSKLLPVTPLAAAGYAMDSLLVGSELAQDYLNEQMGQPYGDDPWGNPYSY